MTPTDPRTAATRRSLLDAATDALREVGYAGASAREIARRAGCNQALVFYHFESVNGLLLAALDDVSERRLAAYRDTLAGARTLRELVDTAERVLAEDLDAGHVAVLTELLVAAASVPGLGVEVESRLAPWRRLAQDAVVRAFELVPLAAVVPADEAAHVVVATLLGLELLAGVGAGRTTTDRLFTRARTVAALLEPVPGTGDAADRAPRPRTTEADAGRAAP
ncbi:TetR/AcrR family transcriptional regulator [Luteimicrobium sp. NPDC057192]|uniref:TetR/AcrR family transcriptional regulator n=1 Tax=Luteimicrobium sp. NPDC057192 TaxID=3346042 RepID=UPI003624BCC1